MVYVIVLSSLFAIFYFTSMCAVFGPVPPKPEPRILKHETRNPNPETRNTKHETRNTKHET